MGREWNSIHGWKDKDLHFKQSENMRANSTKES